jgi:uncharacterized 2Fe-2S/4Fe-4S cluster protein (DUF4445 family)
LFLPEATAIAIDLGTTTLVASIVDETTGKRLASAVALNPQRQFGADVVSRISAAVKSEAVRHEMSRLVNAELEALALQLISGAGLKIESLRRVAIAGNPAMEHLLLDLPVDSIARVPYRPLFTEGKSLNTKGLGWGINAELFVFPLPGGFVGGDLVAFLFGQLQGVSFSTSNVARLFLDLGTNAEIALATAGTIFATSAAAGPAFEGGSLASGMPALPGAINSVTIHDTRVTFTTIGNAHPKGICGTGALTAITSLLEAGLMDCRGRLLSPEEIPSNLANRMIEKNGNLTFLVYRDAGCEILLSQNDIREIQLAKAAIRGGIEVLFNRAGMPWEDIDEVVVSGSFGFSIAADCLKALGVIASGMSDKVKTVSDGVLIGVERFLLQQDSLSEVTAMAGELKMLPLSGNPLFERLFLKHMDLPLRKDS